MVRDLHWPGTGTRNVDAKRDDGMTRENARRDPGRQPRAAVRGRAGSPGRTTHTSNPVPLARAPQVVLLGSLLAWLARRRGAAVSRTPLVGGIPGLLAYFILTPLSNPFRMIGPLAPASPARRSL